MKKHLPRPSSGSACKRLALYARWMVRQGPVDLGLELGYTLIEHGRDEWVYGLAAAWPLAERFELVGEVHGVATGDFEEDVLVFNLGSVLQAHEKINLLFSAGRSFRESSTTEPELLGYLGLQLNF